METSINFEDLTIGQRRSVIAQLGLAVEDVYYYSEDLGESSEDGLELRTILSFIARNLPPMIPEGDILTANVYGAESAGVPYGDWELKVEYRPLADNEDEYQLYKMTPDGSDPSEIRSFLSLASNLTPLTIYHDPGRFEGLGEKTMADGQPMGDSGFAAMMMALYLRDELQAGESYELTFAGQPFGTEPGNVIRITVNRLTME